MADEPVSTRLDPRKARKDSEITIDFGDGTTVLARKLDMTTMVLEGLIPMPLLMAMEKLVSMKDASPADRVKALLADDEDEQGRSMLQLLRKHAVIAVIDPKVVMQDTGDESLMPVELLTLPQLMKIWTLTAVVPLMEPAAAARFRGRASAVPAAHVPTRKSVRPAAEPVDSPAVDFKSH